MPINIYIKSPNIDYSSSDQRLDLSGVDFDSEEYDMGVTIGATIGATMGGTMIARGVIDA